MRSEYFERTRSILPLLMPWLLSSSGHLLLTVNDKPVLVFNHDDVIKWKHFPRNWPFVRGIHLSPVNSPHKGQWREALMFSLICVWINVWVNNREAGDLRRYRAHYDVIVMNEEGFPLPAPSVLTNGREWKCTLHMGAMSFQITDNSSVCSTASSG